MFRQLFCCCEERSKQQPKKSPEKRRNSIAKKDRRPTLKVEVDRRKSKRVTLGSDGKSPIKFLANQEACLSPEQKSRFDHVYFKESIQIIDQLILGQEEGISSLGLNKPVHLNNIYCEKPAFSKSWVSSHLEMMKGNNMDQRKRKEKLILLKMRNEHNAAEILYLIEFQFMKEWIYFIKEPMAIPPKPINNEFLQKKVNSHEKIVLGQDLVLISEKLWKKLLKIYGGGPTLKWKIEEKRHIVKKVIKKTANPYALSMNPIKEEIMYSNSSDSSHFEEDIDISKQSGGESTTRMKARKNEAIQQIKSMYEELADGTDTQGLNLIYQRTNSIYGQYESNRFKGKENDSSPVKSYQNRLKQVAIIRLFGITKSCSDAQLNSIIQSLFSIHNFRKYYQRGNYQKCKIQRPKIGNNVLSYAVENLCSEVQSVVIAKEKRPIKTKYLRPLVFEEFKPQHEEDIFELFNHFITRLSKEQKEKNYQVPPYSPDLTADDLWKDYKASNPSMIDLLFTTIYLNIYTCLSCQHQQRQYSYEFVINLKIKEHETLDDCIYDEMEVRQVRDRFCDNCERKGDAELEKMIVKVPNVLVFRIQRLSFIPTVKKSRDLIAYEDALNFQFLLPQEYENHKQNQNSMYSLQSIIVHQGKMNNGRYMSYVRKENNQWYLADNEKVAQVSLEEVLAQEPHLMFYSRIKV